METRDAQQIVEAQRQALERTLQLAAQLLQATERAVGKKSKENDKESWLERLRFPMRDREAAEVAEGLLEAGGKRQADGSTRYKADGFDIERQGDTVSVTDKEGGRFQFRRNRNGQLRRVGRNTLSEASQGELRSLYPVRDRLGEMVRAPELGDRVGSLGSLAPEGSQATLNQLRGMKAFGLANNTINQLGGNAPNVEVKVGEYQFKRERGNGETRLSVTSGERQLLSYRARREGDTLSVELDRVEMDESDLQQLQSIGQQTEYLAGEVPPPQEPEVTASATLLPLHPEIRRALDALQNTTETTTEINEFGETEEREVPLLSQTVQGRALQSQLRQNDGKLSAASQQMALEVFAEYPSILNQKEIELPTPQELAQFTNEHKAKRVRRRANPESKVALFRSRDRQPQQTEIER